MKATPRPGHRPPEPLCSLWAQLWGRCPLTGPGFSRRWGTRSELPLCADQEPGWGPPGVGSDPSLRLQCLAAGSIIMNRELESMAMRPLAKELTRSLEDVRGALRDQALRDLNTYTEKMREALRHFDVLFAEFELR